MTTRAVVYDHIPGNIPDGNSLHGKDDDQFPCKALMKASMLSEGDDDIYETIIDESTDFVMVPRTVVLPSDDDIVGECHDGGINSDLIASSGGELTQRRSRGIISWIRRSVIRKIRCGWEWVVETRGCLRHQMIVSATSTVTAIQSYEWTGEDSIQSNSHGKPAYLKLPGPLIVFGDPVCVSVPHDDDVLLNRPPTTTSGIYDGTRENKHKHLHHEQPSASGERLTPVTIMVSANDLLAASPHPTTTPPLPCTIDPTQEELDVSGSSEVDESSFTLTHTFYDPLASSSISSINNLRIASALVRQVKIGGKMLIKSAKERVFRVVVDGGTILKLASTQVVDFERRYHVVDTASQLVYNSYEWVIQRQFLKSEQQREEDAAIELTS